MTEPRAGVLLVNLGTPDAPTPAAVRRYLAEFLSDRRVVDLPPVLWRPILHGIVLRTRPRRSARAYASVWGPHGSPLLAHCEALREALEARLADTPVALGMRYGNPSLEAALQSLRERGCERLVVLPLYPQYASSTVGTALEAVLRIVAGWRRIPALRTIAGYHDDSGYLKALAARCREAWREEPPGERLLISFHGLPVRQVAAGDPYQRQCEHTARALAERLALPAGRWALAWQSRFGAGEWLRPGTEQTLEQWAAAGVRRVDVVCPGFAVDCLETLEEIAIRARERFLAGGGERLRYLPALNATPEHVEALGGLIDRELSGWAPGAGEAAAHPAQR